MKESHIYFLRRRHFRYFLVMGSMSRVFHTVYRGVNLGEDRVGTNDLSLYRENRGKQN